MARPLPGLARGEDFESEKELMSKVELNTPAPDFTLTDFNGIEVSLSDFRGNKNVLLVFNRGFF
jgi:cytochrome oxidase Cu insertion factor (SCO1/SenC/PrrC family)